MFFSFRSLERRNKIIIVILFEYPLMKSCGAFTNSTFIGATRIATNTASIIVKIVSTKIEHFVYELTVPEMVGKLE